VKESGAFVSVDTKNKLMVQGQKVMMVHFAGTYKATEDAIQLVKNCLLIYDGENIGELQFGGSGCITPALSVGGQPTVQGITSQNDVALSQEPDEPVCNALKAWGHSTVVTETSSKSIAVNNSSPTVANTKVKLRQDTKALLNPSTLPPSEDKSMPEAISAVSSKSNSDILNFGIIGPNMGGLSLNKDLSGYTDAVTTHDNTNTPPIPNETLHALMTRNEAVVNEASMPPPSQQHAAVPTEIFNKVPNVHGSSLPQAQYYPVHQEQASESSSVSSLEDLSHLKLSDKTPCDPIGEEGGMTKKFSGTIDNVDSDDNLRLLLFLQSQKACIKGSPEAFFRWLVNSEDIASLADLSEAVFDEDYVRETLQVGNGQAGLKGFKRNVFKKALLAGTTENENGGAGGEPRHYDGTSGTGESGALSSGTMATAPNSSVIDDISPGEIGFGSFFNDGGALSQNSFGVGSLLGRGISGGSVVPNDRNIDVIDDGPPELYCPISHELMIKDPVLALDGITYERCAIENWFTRKLNEIQVARQKLMNDPSLSNERYILARGVVSPVRDCQLPHLTLTANISIRNMARDYMCKAKTHFHTHFHS